MDHQPKGRGARMLEALERLRLKNEQERQVGLSEGQVSSSAESKDPPRPRGRAALLSKVKALQEKKAGAPMSYELRVSEGSSTSLQRAVEHTPLRRDEPEEVKKSYKGESGKVVSISANYIRLKRTLDYGVFEYSLAFDPPVDSRDARYKLLNRSVRKISKVYTYDSGSMLYLPKKLENNTTVLQEPHPINETLTTITVTYVKEKRPKDCINVYNILFKKVMTALLYSPIGRKYFSFATKLIVPQHKMEIIPGYAIAVDELEGGLMVCLDAQHRLIRSQNVLDLLYELKATYKQDFKKAAFKRLVGSTVITRYNNKMYKVDEILWDDSPQSFFESHDGRQISYIEYYKKQHDIVIKDLSQPMLLYRKQVTDAQTLEKVDRHLAFVPELCYVTGLTEDCKNDFTFMKDIAQHTRITPNQRVIALRKYLENVANCPAAQNILSDWGLELDDATIDMRARVLDSETILFGNSVKDDHTRNANWDGSVKKNRVIGPVDFKNWIVMFARRDEIAVKGFVEVMLGLGRGMGCEIRKPTMEMLNDDRTESYITKAKKLITKELQIIVFVCPTNRTDLYNAIKKLCCVQMPVSSQVILSFTLKKKQMRAITQKIALQMTCKMGGSLWSLRFPFKTWMICGIDVYHGIGKKSVCAFISSTNEGLYEWHSSVAFQEKEIGDHYKRLFANSLIQYRERRGSYPSVIVIYRDGIGIGQFDKCLQYEVAEFETVLKEMHIEASICFVVVQKRINTRIFLREQDSFVNPPPGTIQDEVVTRGNLCDFFLVSQHVTQGTVTPTHYVVLKDTANIPPDRLQRLTFKLCHLYYNWPGTIRVPAPCQYAHKLAYLVGENIGQKPHDLLRDFLYYL